MNIKTTWLLLLLIGSSPRRRENEDGTAAFLRTEDREHNTSTYLRNVHYLDPLRESHRDTSTTGSRLDLDLITTSK